MTHEAEKPPGEKPRRDWRENARFAANIVNSLAIPLLTVAATIVGIYATNTLKEREIAIATKNNSQSLRNQREESETNLRSAMFRELVGPLLQSETETWSRPARTRTCRAHSASRCWPNCLRSISTSISNSVRCCATSTPCPARPRMRARDCAAPRVA